MVGFGAWVAFTLRNRYHFLLQIAQSWCRYAPRAHFQRLSNLKCSPDPLTQLSLRADVWLPDNHVRFAFSQFPGCLGFIIFPDRKLLVIFPKGYKCIEALNQLPEEFGGLMVGVAEEAGRFSLADTEQQREGRKITVPAAAPPIVRPGESIYIHGPLYGADPPPTTTQRTSIG